MLLAIAETLADGRERGFHIYADKNGVVRSQTQIGDAGSVELHLKELPLNGEDYLLISFHTHNGNNGTPTLQDIETAEALGEAFGYIGYVKNNRPHINRWKLQMVI